MQIHDTPFENKTYLPERLLHALDRVFQYPLTLVVAPSKAGKTAAVQEYLRQNRTSYVNAYWYTAYGESLHATWKGLCSVLSKIDKRTAALLDAVDAPTQGRLPEIAQCMREICCDAPTVLVIDNYQRVRSDAAFELVNALAQHKNACLHIVVITQRLDGERRPPFGTPHMGRIDAQYFYQKEQAEPEHFPPYGFAPRKKEPAHYPVYGQSRVWPAVPQEETEGFPDELLEELWMKSCMYEPLISFAAMLFIADSVPPQLTRTYHTIFLACAKAMAANPEKARLYLRKALDIAMPDLLHLPYAGRGEGPEPLLWEAQELAHIATMHAMPKAGVSKTSGTPQKAHHALTPRERQIAQLAKSGSTNKEIGKALFISPETVKMAMKKIFKKLDIHSRYQL